MAQGGGFCERHGPFDPPHRTCPFCALEDDQRRLYGPPSAGPARAAVASPEAPAREKTPEPDRSEPDELDEPLGLTEAAPVDLIEEDAPPDRAQPLGWLVVKQPVDKRGTILTIGPNQSIGREADIRWDDPGLSRQHARLTLEPPESAPDAPPVFHLWPFAPTNPVYINEREIRGATPLRENDEIRLGNTLFVFKTLTD